MTFVPPVLIDGKPHKLTTKQRAFVKHFVTNGGKPQEAALAAGFSERTARQQAYDLLEKKHIIEAITTTAALQLQQAVPGAVDTLTKLMRTSRSDRIKLEASQDILDRTGFRSPDKVDHRHTGGISVEIDLG